MAQFLADPDDFPLQDQLKTLGDEELLDFWEETQYLERFLAEELHEPVAGHQDYERLILLELTLRSCLRPSPRG